MSGQNSFRMGSAKHATEDDVFEVLDENYVTADFAEVWEFSENELEAHKSRVITQAGTNFSQENSVSLRITNNAQSNRDSVLEYNDRIPNNGQ